MDILIIQHDKCELQIDIAAFFPANQHKIKVLLPMLRSCSAEEIGGLLHQLCKMLKSNAARAEYNTKCSSAARSLRANISAISTACNVAIPDNYTPESSDIKPDYNYKIEIKKLPRVESIPAPGKEIERCIVPIMHRNPDTRCIECYASKGFGGMIDGVPAYAQQVKGGLYILNLCGQSCPSIQWTSAAAAREGLDAATKKVMQRWQVREGLPAALETIGKYMQLPEPPAPDPDDSTEDQTPTEEITAPAPASTKPERPKAKRRAAPDWVGKTMTAYPKKPKKPEWIGRKMIITIGERYARPAGA